MREIKFRAWNKDIKRMCKIIYINFNEENIQVVFNGYRTLFPIEDFEIMQYTGLKDKNGKEIYEGDILMREKSPGNFFGRKILAKVDVYGMDVSFFSMQHLYVIAGNIHENPELLTQ